MTRYSWIGNVLLTCKCINAIKLYSWNKHVLMKWKCIHVTYLLCLSPPTPLSAWCSGGIRREMNSRAGGILILWIFLCILTALWKFIPWATMHLQSMLGWIFSVLIYVREMFYTHYALDMGLFYPNVFRFFSPVSQYPHGGSVVAWIHNLHFDIACCQTVCAT